MNNEIVIYQSNELTSQIEVRIEEDTIWLTQNQIVELFDSSKANISEHIKHIFETGELDDVSTVRKFRTVRREGKRDVTRELVYYSLDVIISVGYRVNSKRGTQFRIWANKVLKEYLLKGYALNNRMNRIEDNVQALSEKVSKIDVEIKSSLKPKHGILFNGQIFDAYAFISDIIRAAKKSIVLIDNYIDDSVLTILSKRQKNVSAAIYTKSLSKKLKLDLKKHKSQYPEIMAYEFKNAHDRFLIIGEQQLYHFGASLKDLGKKWFAFSRMDSMTDDVLQKLKKGGDDE